MLKNNTNLGGYGVKFHRFNEVRTVSRNGENVELNQKKTTCSILDRSNNTIGTATVILHSGDIDSRPLGRKFAFEKVMRNIDLSKEEKSNIWDDYLTQTGVKKETETLELA